MRFVESSSPRDGRPGRLVFEFDNEDERKVIESAIERGTHWLRLSPGLEPRLHPAFEPVPEVPDPLTAAQWKQGPVIERADTGLRGDGSSRAFFVSGLGAYDGRYAKRALLLENAGFACLRSRRGEDGRIWEFWYLPSKWSAEGPIKGMDDDAILSWLCQLGPGNITESGRTWGLEVDP